MIGRWWMRSREQIEVDMVTAARPSDENKYLLRLLKTELLTVELLMDIRDLLQTLQPPTIITTREDANARTDSGTHN